MQDERAHATAENKFASDLYSLYLPDGQRITQSKPTIDGRRVPCFEGLALQQPNLTIKASGYA